MILFEILLNRGLILCYQDNHGIFDTNQKYDKDVFRQDIGDLIETYKAVLARMQNK